MKTTKLFELKKIQSDFPKVKITKSLEASEFIRQFYGDDLEIFESFFILLLDRSNTTIGYAKISQGGISGTIVDLKLIAKYAVDALATSVILAHNHPSGNLNPSESDIKITNKAVQGLKILDINVIEHIILTKDSYYSLQDNGHI
jgi:DNA repair protein RadC